MSSWRGITVLNRGGQNRNLNVLLHRRHATTPPLEILYRQSPPPMRRLQPELAPPDTRGLFGEPASCTSAWMLQTKRRPKRAILHLPPRPLIWPSKIKVVLGLDVNVRYLFYEAPSPLRLLRRPH